MYSNTPRPKWWQVYLTFPLLIVLFVLDNHIKLSERGHQVVQIGIVLIVFGLVHLWLKANATALSKMDQNQFHGTTIVIQIPPHQLSDTNGNKHPMFQFPNSEIKGTLSDTFEMDYIDAEFSSVDAAPNETNKE
jgi:K+ transporter